MQKKNIKKDFIRTLNLGRNEGTFLRKKPSGKNYLSREKVNQNHNETIKTITQGEKKISFN